MANVSFREATVADCVAVAEVHVRSWKESFAGIVPQSFLDRMSVEKRAAAFAELAADRQGGVPGSTHTVYRTVLRVRRELGLGRGAFAWHTTHDAATAYERVLKPTSDGGEGFLRLLLNFTWWVNRKDPDGKNVFEGGFLGLDNIGVFDRSAPLPTGGSLDHGKSIHRSVTRQA